MTTLSSDIITAIVNGTHRDPFGVLGPHQVELNGQSAIVIRAFLPHARAVSVAPLDSTANREPMLRLHDAGLFEAVFNGRASPFRYRLLVSAADGSEPEVEDPYAFPSLLGDMDLYLIGEGTHYRTYEKLGAHLRECSPLPNPSPNLGEGQGVRAELVRGVHFAVWAPNAQQVSVIGPFNQWDRRVHPMRFHPGVGVWDIFLPGLEEGELYKYEIFNRARLVKSDPYGFFSELRPNTASVVYDIDAFQWHDDEWLKTRAERNALDAPIAIYEVHLGSWRRKSTPPTPPPRPSASLRTSVGEGSEMGWLNYRELAHELVDYVKQMGYTHIELLPIMEHPYDGSWGYQVTGFFAPTSRYGTPSDFMYFVDHCHQNGIGVLLDWVPAHFPKDGHGLNYFDGTHLYEHADPRLGTHQEWGTLIFNYGRNEVRNFLLSNALFWLDKYHIDGLRVDAVAAMLYLDYSRKAGEWLPNKYGGRENLEAIDFIKRFNELVHAEHPGVVTMAEESTSWPLVSHPVYLGGLGFDLKWNMGWMHDMLKYMAMDPLFRRNNQNSITFSLMYAFSENFILPLSHDEVVHLKKSLIDKMPGDLWRKFANLRAFYGYMLTHPGKKLLFMGGEFGQWHEWSEKYSLDWDLLNEEFHSKLQRYVADLNKLYRAEPALHEVDFSWEGFEWIDFQDIDHSVIAFLRRAKDKADCVVVVCNFTPLPRHGYRIGVPTAGEYRELINSDSAHYWGSNLGNGGGVTAEETKWHNQPYSVVLTLPPLSTVILKNFQLSTRN